MTSPKEKIASQVSKPKKEETIMKKFIPLLVAVSLMLVALPCYAFAVEIDIKPGSDPNSINPNSKGRIPVAILSDAGFDATTVDPDTVTFGPDGASAMHSALEDVDIDGDIDMILHFKTQDTGIACDDTSASLAGETFGGTPITGSDSINTVGCE